MIITVIEVVKVARSAAVILGLVAEGSAAEGSAAAILEVVEVMGKYPL
eukprot:SAG31_NODE_904_length_11120_cov_76.575084_12_plen_48_part_00